MPLENSELIKIDNQLKSATATNYPNYAGAVMLRGALQDVTYDSLIEYLTTPIEGHEYSAPLREKKNWRNPDNAEKDEPFWVFEEKGCKAIEILDRDVISTLGERGIIPPEVVEASETSFERHKKRTSEIGKIVQYTNKEVERNQLAAIRKPVNGR